MCEFTQIDLDRLCRRPDERLLDAVRNGSPADVLDCFARMVSLIRDIADRCAGTRSPRS